MRRISWLCIVAIPLLSGCDLESTANSLGEYMPVIGDRCESSQCITESGRISSDSVKAERLRQQQQQQALQKALAAQQAGAPVSAASPLPALPAAKPPAPPADDPFDTVEPF